MKVSPEFFAMVIGVLLSLAVDILPKFKDWFAKLTGYHKRWFTIFLNLIVTVLIVMLGCNETSAGFLTKYVLWTCTEAGIIEIAEVFFAMLIMNQVTFSVAPANGRGRPKP